MKKAERIFDRVIDAIELALNLIIMGVIGAQIITRTFFNAPLKFPEEVAVFAMIAMIFGGICMVEKDDSYLRIEVFQQMMPRPLRRLFGYLGKVTILVLVYGIIQGEISLYPRIAKLTTHAAGIPYKWLHTWIIVFTLVWGFWALVDIWRLFKRRGDKEC